MRNKRRNIPKINKKETITKINEIMIYGYISCNNKIIAGFNIFLNSFCKFESCKISIHLFIIYSLNSDIY